MRDEWMHARLSFFRPTAVASGSPGLPPRLPSRLAILFFSSVPPQLLFSPRLGSPPPLGYTRCFFD